MNKKGNVTLSKAVHFMRHKNLIIYEEEKEK